MKKVYSARDEIDAQLVKGFLDDQGIESIVQANGLQQILGSIPVTADTLPSIWVRDEDIERATDAIAGFKADAVPAQPVADPWRCPKCGELVEPQFTECWNCGTTKPEA
ncbi:MAG TPA: DUF2007 domain-containing protein [Tepidisphaeraceae bacterium]|nr:DUF2007 domain-containing protein [Tepidisphaeraceae bacterium]